MIFLVDSTAGGVLQYKRYISMADGDVVFCTNSAVVLLVTKTNLRKPTIVPKRREQEIKGGGE